MVSVFERAVEERLRKANTEGKLEIAKNMLQEGEPIEKIVRFTGLSRSQIQNLSKGR